ncbi:MAG: hypothetical protein ACTSPY_12370 [Candidatus Helarchaeota archaeon]
MNSNIENDKDLNNNKEFDLNYLIENNIFFTINQISAEDKKIKNKINTLELPEIEKDQIIQDLFGLPKNERILIFKRIVEESPINIEKYQIQKLIQEFEILEHEKKWEQAVHLLRMILEIAIKDGYELIFEKLFLKYKTILEK